MGGQSVCDPGFIRQIVGAVFKQLRGRVGAGKGSAKAVDWQGKQGSGGAFGDGFIGVSRENRQQFGAVFRSERPAPGANSELSLARGAVRAYLFAQLQAD